jgi:hypothetical protein
MDIKEIQIVVNIDKKCHSMHIASDQLDFC